MKRFAVVIAMLVALVAMSVGVAYAGSAFSNAKGDFEPLLDRGVDDASGQVVVNYVKGQSEWTVTGVVHDMKPDTEYKVQIGVQGKANPNFDLGYFTTDGKGKATFKFQNVSIPGTLGQDYEIVRIIDPAGALNPGVGGSIMMLAREDGTVGSLEFRGTQRGE